MLMKKIYEKFLKIREQINRKIVKNPSKYFPKISQNIFKKSLQQIFKKFSQTNFEKLKIFSKNLSKKISKNLSKFSKNVKTFALAVLIRTMDVKYLFLIIYFIFMKL